MKPSSLLPSVSKLGKSSIAAFMSLLALLALLTACGTGQTAKAVRPDLNTIEAPDSPNFKVLGLNIAPFAAEQGQQVNISVDIFNQTNVDRNYQANLLINNKIEASQVVKIPAGYVQTINYVVSKSIPGDYRVSFAGLSTGFAINGKTETVATGEATAGTVSTTGTTSTPGTFSSLPSCCDTSSTGATSTSIPSCCGGVTSNTPQPQKPATSAWGNTGGGSCCGN